MNGFIKITQKIKTMSKSKILVFASGTKTGGGSGFEKLIENSKTGMLSVEIAGVVSNNPEGGVRQIADRERIQFLHFPGPYVAGEYRKVIEASQADFVVLSGWLKLIEGHDPVKTINIHPGPLPELGGDGMYGIHVSEAAIKLFKEGKLKYSAVSMHFVTPRYDEGPIFFKYPIVIKKNDTPETLFVRVNKIEHGWQSFITNLVVNGEIRWDGEGKVEVPGWYERMGFL